MLSLNDIKPLGAFVENTIRPIINEFSELLKECKAQGINLTEDNIIRVVKQVTHLHLRTIMMQAIRDIVIALIVAGIIWKFNG